MTPEEIKIGKICGHLETKIWRSTYSTKLETIYNDWCWRIQGSIRTWAPDAVIAWSELLKDNSQGPIK